MCDIHVVNIARTDLNLLRVLDVLLLERHATRAAARLNLSQPALSAALKRARHAFDDPLFVRTGRGLAPTLKMERLAPRVRAAMAQIEQVLAHEPGFDPARARLDVQLALTDYLQELLKPALLELLDRAPGLRVALRLPQSELVTAQLAAGELDAAVLNLARAPPGARARVLFEDRLVLIASRGHPRIKRAPTLKQLCAEEHALVSPRGGAFAAQTDDALAKLKLTRRVRISVQSFARLPELVADSTLIALCPERYARTQTDRVRIFEPPLPLPRFRMALVWHERAHRDAAQQWLRAWLVESLL